jgi:transcriptional antiterminator NusG
LKYYTIQVKNHFEERFISLFHERNPALALPLYFPRRIVPERRGGGTEYRCAPVFPGYLFAGIGDEEKRLLSMEALRVMENFFRFLPANSAAAPLSGRDLEIVLHFIKNDESAAGVSSVYFDTDERIVVVSGALKGLEGRIIKVDRRKGRAKIKLDLYGTSFRIDLAFETIDRS